MFPLLMLLLLLAKSDPDPELEKKEKEEKARQRLEYIDIWAKAEHRRRMGIARFLKEQSEELQKFNGYQSDLFHERKQRRINMLRAKADSNENIRRITWERARIRKDFPLVWAYRKCVKK
jgi:hypothetical protein